MSITVLRSSLALVLGFGAVVLLRSLAERGHPGLPGAISLALGGAELISAVVFLVPRASRAGGIALLGVLAVAAVLHVATGQPPPLSFVVYAAAIWVVIAHRPRTVPGGAA